MRKTMKRMWALLLAVVIAAASCMTLFATDAGTQGAAGTTPSDADKATVTVNGITATDTLEVKAYKIVKADYTPNGFTGYSAVNDNVKNAIQNIEDPTAEEIFKIAQNTGTYNLGTGTPLTKTGDAYTAEVEAGVYIVLVTGGAPTVYNPMIVSAYYAVDGSGIAGGTVSAADNWRLDGTTTVAKSSEPTITKTITAPADGNEKGSDAAIGDTISYQVTTQIPSYSAQYTAAKFAITDTMSAGITPDATSVKVTVGGTTVAQSADTFTVAANGQTTTIDFISAYVLANSGKEVTVTYSGTLNGAAGLNMDKNSNTAEVAYTSDPTYKGDGSADDESKVTKKEDTTYTYTFALDGNVNGTQTTLNKKTHELIKVDEKGEVQGGQTFDDGTTETTVTNALAGAEFTLTNNATNKVYTAVTNTNGYFEGFTGLDAGTYTLVETKAPAGYTLDTTEHEVVIAATYNTDGTLEKYTVTIDGQTTSTYTATYTGKTINTIIADMNTTFIKNTKLGALPSTGGIGTYLFTVIGVALMAVAVMLSMRKRRQA